MQKLGLIIAAVIFVVDQITKPVILGFFGNPTLDQWVRPVEVLPFFNLVLVWNKGVSFGILSNDHVAGPFLLAGLAVIIAVGIWFWFMRSAETRYMAVCCGLIVGGAFGNAADRLLYGAVVDFLDFHVAGYHWPAFNVADCAIVVGAILLAADGLFVKRDAPT